MCGHGDRRDINLTRLDELNMVLTDKRENVALYIKI